jgi:hypothetical protein
LWLLIHREAQWTEVNQLFSFVIAAERRDSSTSTITSTI